MPATVQGLAAAVLTHLKDRHVQPAGSAQNEYEKWMAVDFEVDSNRGAIPLSVMVMEVDRQDLLHEAGTCSEGDRVLSCRVEHAHDGSVVVAETSTENITGGITNDGLFVFATQLRADHAVLVVEEVPSRAKRYVNMRGLPIDLDVLVEIAADPYVGTTTAKTLNQRGRELPGFTEEAP